MKNWTTVKQLRRVVSNIFIKKFQKNNRNFQFIKFKYLLILEKMVSFHDDSKNIRKWKFPLLDRSQWGSIYGMLVKQ